MPGRLLPRLSFRNYLAYSKGDAINTVLPVVLVDRMLKGGAFTSWIAPDNYAIGVGIGQYIVKQLNGQGLVVVLRGGPADNSIGLAAL